jgi:hypothetical protein
MADEPRGIDHPIERWTFANAAARIAATGLFNQDVGKLAFQQDTSQYFRLVDTTPTWQVIGSGGVSTKPGNYTVVEADYGSLIVTTGVASSVITLPATSPGSYWRVAVLNLCTNVITIARNGLNINGAASNINLTQSQLIFIWSDGTNYFTTPALIAGAGITLTPAANGITIDIAANEAWSAPTLVNGWVNFGGVQAAGYMKDRMGFVHLRGNIKNGGTTVGTILFTLPAGYRPAANEIFVVGTNTTETFQAIAIDPSGNVKLDTAANSALVTLSGITFSTV